MGNAAAAKTEDRLTYYQKHPFYYRILPGLHQQYAPVLFLGGAFQTMDSLRRSAQFFNQFTTVLLVDPPGMGKSPTLSKTVELDFLADSTCVVLEELQIPQVCVVAASYGSLIAYRFAQKHPGRVSHLVLTGVMDHIPADWRRLVVRHLEALIRRDMDRFAREVVKALTSQSKLHRINHRKAIQRVLFAQLRQLSGDRALQYVANTHRLLFHLPLDLRWPPRVRALLFTGEYDPFTKPEYVRAMARAFDDAVFTTIREADHLWHLEQFETAVELVHRFFSNADLDGIDGCNTLEYFYRSISTAYVRDCRSS